jgi:cell division protein FtsL
MKFWYFFALKFIKLLLLNRYKFLPFVLLLSIFLTLEIAAVYVKNEVYFLSIKTQQTEKDIQKEKEKQEYLKSIFLDLTSYEKLIEVVDIKNYEKDNSDIKITIDRK